MGEVRLGIDAPKSCRILRHELILEVGAENRSALAGDDGTAAALSALLAAKPEPEARREPA